MFFPLLVPNILVCNLSIMECLEHAKMYKSTMMLHGVFVTWSVVIMYLLMFMILHKLSICGLSNCKSNVSFAKLDTFYLSEVKSDTCNDKVLALDPNRKK